MQRFALVALSCSLLGLFPQDKDDGCSSRVLTTIPVSSISSCTVVPPDVLIISTREVILTSPSMIWLSKDASTVKVGWLCGGDEAGWVHLQELTVPVGPGCYDVSWTDKFGKVIRVITPCNGLTEDACEKLAQARVARAEKMWPPAGM